MSLTKEYLSDVLSYSPETGVFKWKVKAGPCSPGSLAGSYNSHGYRLISVNHQRYFAHRLAWLFFYGELPDGFDIDHINGIRDDNRISNLRLATRSQNNMNSIVSSKNKSGCRGVCFHKRDKLWHARVFVGRKAVAFKTFKDKDDAVEFVTSERAKIFGNYEKKVVNAQADAQKAR
ncbi:HNH endonuclease signature motif containing protein [Cronobacter sakazakii]|uniref:HNH endonuclease signature motif containing protein n=1 Tax=Cronobacter sakazakii TaxID=28141 RepID=UPI0013762D33|nr:HNH endonuclease signature motif containing protein [Cronobacter sakazakii]NCH77582.1 HNH endonuclease [Cronobacter sakazakii]